MDAHGRHTILLKKYFRNFPLKEVLYPMMKTYRSFLSVAACVIATGFALPALAQPAPAPVQTPPGLEKAEKGKHRGDWQKNLTQEQRDRLKAARQKAMEQPTVKAAREQMKTAADNYHSAMKAAMLAADPGLKDFLPQRPAKECDRSKECPKK
jgi:hypothetical protein